jgi:AcrR family transcriptional regulator
MGRDGREALLDAAERLFATLGLDAVSLRQIGVEAGQRNTAAAHYHFGTKDALVDALFERRMTPVNEHRWRLLRALDDAGRGDDPAGLIEAFVVPFAATVRPGSTYARFSAQVISHPTLNTLADLDRPFMSGLVEVFVRLERVLGDDRLWPERRRLLAVLVVQGLADRERLLEAGIPQPDDDTALAALIDTATAVARPAPTKETSHA